MYLNQLNTRSNCTSRFHVILKVYQTEHISWSSYTELMLFYLFDLIYQKQDIDKCHELE